ncbi:hypothetical protein [Angustibacter aerolatus]
MDDARPSLAARVVSRGGVGAATLVLVVAVLAVPLGLTGLWRPVVVLPLLLVALAGALVAAHRTPVLPSPRWAAGAIVLLALGGGLWAGLTHAEHVVLRRDAGTYALSGQHLATAHEVRVDVRVADLGGAAVVDDSGVTSGSPGFFEQGSGAGTHVVPQFLLATPAWLSIGWWLGGWTGMLLVPAVALGAALLAFGGLALRVLGPRWAVPATALLAAAQPVLHAGRSTYSEPLALLVGCAGLALLVDTTRVGAAGGWTAARRLALPAGLLLGGVALVRVDALRETALLLPVAALLAVRRDGGGGRLALGLGIGTAVAAASALLTSRPYLGSIGGSLLPLAAGVVVLLGASLGLVALARRGVRLGGVARRRLPEVLEVLVLLAFVVLASRPLWQTVRQSPDDPGSRVVAGLQLAQGLPVDGGRTYAEHTVQWTAWWLGVPAVVLAALAAASLAARVGRAWRDDRPLPAWTGPLLVAVGSTALTLYRPGITPDHPWADRRLVTVVLPAVVLLSVAAVRGLAARVPAARVPVAVVGLLALAVPVALATAPTAGERTERGEVAALHRACRAFGPGDTAVLVDSRAANEWTQVLRGACDVPTVVVRTRRGQPLPAETVATVVRGVEAAGRRPVLVAADPAGVTGATRQVVGLRTTEDARLLERRPGRGVRLDVDLWLAPVRSSAR